MILSLLLSLSTITATAPVQLPLDVQLKEAERASAAGRFDQARMMIANAIASGAKPSDTDRAVANLDFASGKYAEALALYQKLLASAPDDAVLLEHAGIAALQTGDVKLGRELIERATASPAASWRAWNARGAIADMRQDWAEADSAYAKAAELSPSHAEIANNRGWSLVLRGDWSGATGYFERAAKLDPRSDRIVNNLELARTALAADLPRRRAGEEDREWAARLNDAGVAAQVLGDKTRAIAAFTQALEASGSWYERAANNLEAASGR